MSQKQKSQLLSLLLRHRPDTFGLKLDRQGWVGVTDLLEALAHNGQVMSREELRALVTSDEKSRFTFSADGSQIRAAQGHSVDIDLQLVPRVPPQYLYHGTVLRFLDRIFAEGLKPQKRQFVHLSEDIETATKVGSRRGKPVVLILQTTKLTKEGHEFYLSENGVWLTEYVPAEDLSQRP